MNIHELLTNWKGAIARITMILAEEINSDDISISTVKISEIEYPRRYSLLMYSSQKEWNQSTKRTDAPHSPFV